MADRSEYFHNWYLQHREELRLKKRKENPKKIHLFYYTVTAPNGMQKKYRTASEIAHYFGYNANYMQKLLKGSEPHIILGHIITKERRYDVYSDS